MGVVTKGNALVILYFLPVIFHVFLYDILQAGLLGNVLFIGGQQIIQEGASSMNNILIFLEDCVGDGFDGNVESSVGIGGDIDESEQGLEDDQFIRVVLHVINQDVRD